MMSADNQQERLNNLSPWYITGFVEGEGTFHVAIYKDPKMKFGLKLIPEFHINQSVLRQETLLEIKKYFGCGYIKNNHRRNIKDDTLVYVVRNRKDLISKIIPFFEKYPLLSNKKYSFSLFKQIVNLLDGGKHSTLAGGRKILDLAYQMNGQGKYRKIDKKKLLDYLESSETIRRNSDKNRDKI
ncbi:LAGLIDADG family homing endonuclease [Candidatus Falkowbacteria bacterium]|nr:LAGLIDADG family homing endonuclease [Candidatus Falkowbacteria bacterium]